MASVKYHDVEVVIKGTRAAPKVEVVITGTRDNAEVSVNGRARVFLAGGAAYNTRAGACPGAYIALDDNGAAGHALVLAVAPDGELKVAWCYTRVQLREAGCTERVVDMWVLTSHIDEVQPHEVNRVTMGPPAGAAPWVYDMARCEFSEVGRAKYEKIAASTGGVADVFATQHGEAYSHCEGHGIEPHVRQELGRLYKSQEWFVDLLGTEAHLSALDRLVALCVPPV